MVRTRRLSRAAVAVAVAAAVVGPAAPAAAQPAGPAPPAVRCALTDPGLAETSGLVDTPAGPVVVGDGPTTTVETLGPDCSVVASRSTGVRGRDVEDLARSADGTLWLADVGDNRARRSSVSLIRLPATGDADEVRLVYPDGPRDAEALLLPADGRPVIVTKALGGRSGIYTTDGPLPALGAAPSTPLPLRRVGEVAIPPSATLGGVLGAFGRGLVTGGALSVDGRVAALRTYTDAWLYPVAGPTAPDVVAGLAAVPAGVPLPDEPQGEAVAFTADGTLLSAGESAPPRLGLPGGTGTLRAVPGAAALVGGVGTGPSGDGVPGSGDAAAGRAGSGTAATGGAGPPLGGTTGGPDGAATPDPSSGSGTGLPTGLLVGAASTLGVAAAALVAVVAMRRRRGAGGGRHRGR